MGDFICMGLLDLWGAQTENYKMKNSCPQWDSNRGPSAYKANTLCVELFIRADIDHLKVTVFYLSFLCKLPVPCGWCNNDLSCIFIRPSSDGTYYGMVMSVRVSVRPSVRLSVMFVGVMPLLELRILEIHSFPHFSLTCFEILSWNFAYDFVSPYYTSSLSVVNFCGSYASLWT